MVRIELTTRCLRCSRSTTELNRQFPFRCTLHDLNSSRTHSTEQRRRLQPCNDAKYKFRRQQVFALRLPAPPGLLAIRCIFPVQAGSGGDQAFSTVQRKRNASAFLLPGIGRIPRVRSNRRRFTLQVAFTGWTGRDRTSDHAINSRALYHLSYCPMLGCGRWI